MAEPGQSKYIIPLHGQERPHLSFFLWTIFIGGIVMETCLHVFIAEPAGMTIGITAKKLSIGKHATDHENRLLEYARLPIFLNQNQEFTNGFYDKNSRVHDDTASFWENPMAKNTRSGLVPICNPSFTFGRYMKDEVQEHFKTNFKDQAAYANIWVDMPRLDFSVADGMVGILNANRPDSEKIWHYWQDVRKCLVQGLNQYPVESANIKILRAHSLIQTDILPSSQYSTFENLPSPFKIEQTESFFWNWDTKTDLTASIYDDNVDVNTVLTCKTGEETCIADATNADTCVCTMKDGVTDFVYKMDEYQIMLNKNVRNMARTFSDRRGTFELPSLKEPMKYALTNILPMLIHLSGLYFPHSRYINSAVTKNILRVVVLYNIMELQQNFLTKVANTFRPICWPAEGASSEEEGYDPMRSINCDFSDGMKFIAWRLLLNWLYLIVSFMWRSDHTRILAYAKDFKEARVGWGQNKRGLSATNPINILFAFVLFTNIFVTNGADLLQFFSVTNAYKTKFAPGDSVPFYYLLFHLLNKQTYELGQGVFGMMLVYFSAYLPTRVHGTVNNKPHNSQQQRGKLIMYALILIIPFPQIGKIIGQEKVGEFLGPNLAVFFLWFLQVPRYAVYLQTLNNIGSCIATDAYWIFQVLRYAFFLLFGVLAAMGTMWSINCDFNYAPHKFENYAALGSDFSTAGFSPDMMNNLRHPAGIADLCPRSIQQKGMFYKFTSGEWGGGADLMKEFYQINASDPSQGFKVLFREIIVTGIDADDVLNMTHVADTANSWQSTYLTSSLYSLMYSVIAAASSAGGDLSPSSVNEKLLTCLIFLSSVFLIQTKLTYVFSTAIMSTFIEKMMFVKNAAACIFIHKTKANKHRIDHTVSLLWRHWDLWRGMNPHTHESDDLEILPRPVRQELNFFILEELLKRNKSVIMSKLSPAKLKHLSEEIEYHVVHANDVVLGSLKVQEFVLLVKSGQLMITDNDNEEHKADIDIDCVYFEKECFLSTPVNYTIRCFSDYSEFYTIPRSHFCDVVKTAKNLDSIIDKLNLSPLQMRILEHQLDAKEKQLNTVHVVCEDPPKMLKGDILSKPMLAKHNKLNIDFYADLKNYHFKTPKFVHNFESIVSYNNMNKEFIRLKYESDSVTKNVNSAKLEAYQRNFPQKMEELIKLEAIKLTNEEDCFDMRGPVTEFKRYLASVQKEIFTERENLGKHLLEDTYENPSKSLWDGDDIDVSGNTLQTKRNSIGGDKVVNAADMAALMLKKKQAMDNRLKQEEEEEAKADDKDEYFLQITPGSTPLLYWQRINALHSFFAFFATTLAWSFMDPTGRTTAAWGSKLGGYMTVANNWFLIDSIAFFDFAVYLYTGFDDETNTIIFHPKTRFNRMTFSDFMIRMIGIFPFEFLFPFLPSTYRRRDFLAYYLSARMVKTIYYYKMPNNELERDAIKLYSPLTSVLLSTAIQCLFVMQMCSCGIYKMACSASNEQKEKFQLQGECEPGTWAWQQFEENIAGTADKKNDMQRWWVTLLWMIKQFFAYSTVGITSNRSLSRILVSFVLLMGIMFLAKIVAVMSALFELSVREGQKAEKKAHLQFVLDMIRNAPTALKEKVTKTKLQVFNKYNGFALPGFYEIEDCLFPIDKLLVKYEAMNPVLDQIPLFQDLPSNISHKLAMQARNFQYCKGQVIIHERELVPYLYYIHYGTVEIRSSGQIVGYLEASNTFNTLNMVAENNSKYEFIAHTGCELIEWKRTDIQTSCGDNCWNIFNDDFVQKCKVRMCMMRIVPKTQDMQAIEASREEHANQNMINNGFSESDTNMSNSGLIRPDSESWINYQKWNTVRLCFHVITAGCVSSIFYDQGTIFKIILLIFDALAIFNMVQTSKVMRRNPETQMLCEKAAFSRKFYIKHGLVYDLFSCVFPTVLDFVWGFDSGITFMMRLFQLLNAHRYFKYIYKNTPKTFSSIISACYFKFMIIVAAAVIGLRFARFEGSFNEGKLGAVIGYTNTDNRFDSVSVKKGWNNATMEVAKGSWVAQFNLKINDPTAPEFSGINLENPFHWVVLCFYYWVNVTTATAASGVNPMKFSYAAWFELVIQLVGLFICVYICVEFKEYGNAVDKRRQQASSQYHCLKLFFQNTVGFANEKLKNRILSQFNWNHSIHSDHVEAQIYDGLNLAARKDLAYERYGTVLRALYVDNTDDHLAELEARDLAVHVEKLAVSKGTTLIYENQMTESIFFIAKGKFVHSTGEVLHTGAYIVPENGISKNTITCEEFGWTFVISKEKFDCHHSRWRSDTHQAGVENPKLDDEVVDAKHFECPTKVAFAGMIFAVLSFVIGGHMWLSTIDNVFGLAVIYMVYSKNKDYTNYTFEEKMVIFGCIPMVGDFRFIIRMVFFYIENENCYIRAFEDLDIRVYYYRILKFSTYILGICSVVAGILTRIICPGGVCNSNSLLQSTELLVDDGDGNMSFDYANADLKSRFDLFINLFYAAFDGLSSAGFGNMGPHMVGNIFILGVVTFIGRVNEAALLGLGNDILGHEIDGLTSNYLSIRNRIRTYMREMGCEAKRYGYICGFIDASFNKTNYFKLNTCLENTAVAPGLRRDFYYELFASSLKKVDLFKSCSESCLAEICERACKIEYYFAGNIVQEADTDFMGVIVLMKGSMTIDDESVAIEGDAIFEDIAEKSGNDLAPQQVKAFSECQIIRVDYQVASEIMAKMD